MVGVCSNNNDPLVEKAMLLARGWWIHDASWFMVCQGFCEKDTCIKRTGDPVYGILKLEFFGLHCIIWECCFHTTNSVRILYYVLPIVGIIYIAINFVHFFSSRILVYHYALWPIPLVVLVAQR